MQLKIEYMPAAELKPYESNAKLHPAEQVEQIKESIRQFGFLDPIAIWKDSTIIEGHGRLLAALDMGIDTVPVIRLDSLTDAQRRAYALVHNQLTLSSGFDMELLQLELDKVSLDFDMSALGFDTSADKDPEDVEEVPVPEEPETATTKPGEIYQLGRHRLICGDSTDPETAAALVDGAAVDLLLTDPPYNVDVGSAERPRTNKNNKHIKNDNMSPADFICFLSSALHNASDHMRPGAAFYIWYAGLHHSEFDASVKNIMEFKLHEQLIWVKTHFVLGRNSDYQWRHECCLYGWKDGAPHFFTDSRAETTVIEDKPLTGLKKHELIALVEKLRGETGSSTVLYDEKPTAALLHPTVKPQGLLAKLIRNSSRKGELILDLFGGSGSTLIAAEQLNRRCYMAELDPHYCDVIIQRWETLTGQKAVKL